MGAENFNQPLNNWNANSVKNMDYMFRGAKNFNQDISSWDTRNTTSMKYMFREARNYVNGTDPENYKKIGYYWDMSKVTHMIGMFLDAHNNFDNISFPVFFTHINSGPIRIILNINDLGETGLMKSLAISEWFGTAAEQKNNKHKIVKKYLCTVRDMSAAFKDKNNFNEDITRWNVTNVTNMQEMFKNAAIFNKDITVWSPNRAAFKAIDSVLSIQSMFFGATEMEKTFKTREGWGFSPLMSFFSTPGFISITQANIHTAAATIDVSGYSTDYGPVVTWNITSVTDLSGLFDTERGIAINDNINTSYWHTHNVTNMYKMFNGQENFTADISEWDTSKVIDMASMFKGNKLFNVPLNTWNTSNVTNMGSMFEDASGFNQDVSSWNTSKVTDMIKMFKGATAFKNGGSGASKYKDMGYYWDVNASKDKLTYMFQDAAIANEDNIIIATSNGGITLLQNIGVSPTDKFFMHFNNAITRTIPVNHFPFALIEWNGDASVRAANIYGHIRNWDTVNVIVMSNAFSGNNTFNEDITSWNTSNVIDLSDMFVNANDFNQNIGFWNVTKVTNMEGVFQGASKFNKPLNKWDTSNVTDMSGMFQRASGFNQDISSWDVSKVVNIHSMFSSAADFKNGPSENDYKKLGYYWDTRKVTDMTYMFLNSAFIGKTNPFNSDPIGSTPNENFFKWNSSHLSGPNYIIPYTGFNTAIQEWFGTEMEKLSNQHGHIRHWNVSDVKDMHGAFQNKITFNENITKWDISMLLICVICLTMLGNLTKILLYGNLGMMLLILI